MQPGLRRLELAGLNSWPAQTQLLVHGWMVRLGDGYTKRANSVTAPFGYDGDLLQDLLYCESLYLARGLPPIFRLTQASQPTGLDGVLAQRGYGVLDPTLVLARDLDHAPEMPSGVELCSGVEAWLDAYVRLLPTTPQRLLAHKALLGRIALPSALILVHGEPEGAGGVEPVGCVLAVQDQELIGVFDLIVDPARRRRRYGHTLMQAVMAWGAQRGARSVYLQVVEANLEGRAFYDSLGFSQIYRYWYRVPDGAP